MSFLVSKLFFVNDGEARGGAGEPGEEGKVGGDEKGGGGGRNIADFPNVFKVSNVVSSSSSTGAGAPPAGESRLYPPPTNFVELPDEEGLEDFKFITLTNFESCLPIELGFGVGAADCEPRFSADWLFPVEPPFPSVLESRGKSGRGKSPQDV